MKLRILALAAAAAAVALVPAAHGVVKAHPLTTEPDVYDQVDVTITDSKIIMSAKTSQRGNGVDFHVRNIGRRAHNFALIADTSEITGLGHEGLATPMLKPKASAVLQVYLDVRGDFLYRSLAPADRAKPGMHGKFSVT